MWIATIIPLNFSVYSVLSVAENKPPRTQRATEKRNLAMDCDNCSVHFSVYSVLSVAENKPPRTQRATEKRHLEMECGDCSTQFLCVLCSLCG